MTGFTPALIRKMAFSLFFIATTTAVKAAPSIYGEMSNRFQKINETDSPKYENFGNRTSVGFKGLLGERIRYDSQLQFSANSNPNNPYANFSNDFAPATVSAPLFYFKWNPFPFADLYFGKHPFVSSRSTLLWDENINPSGASQSLGILDTNARVVLGEYILQGTNPSKIPFMIMIQPGWRWTQEGSWGIDLAATLYIFKSRGIQGSGYSLPQNRYCGVDPNIFSFFGKLMFPVNLEGYFEVSYNTKAVTYAAAGGASNEKAMPVALLAGARYGTLKTSYDWQVGLEIVQKGLGAAPGSTSWTAFDVPFDRKGFILKAGFALEDNFFITVRNTFLYDADGKNLLGDSLGTKTVNSYQLLADLSIQF